MTGPDDAIGIGGCGGRRIIPAVFQLLAMTADYGFDLDTSFHQPRVDVSGGVAVTVDRRLPVEIRRLLDEACTTILADPVLYPFPFTIAGAVRRTALATKGRPSQSSPGPRRWRRTRSNSDFATAINSICSDLRTHTK
ncbi:MAG: hypothetical protein HC868_01505 [Sphingomonadales bacterium]|nr:hypothetical protein [Sphingomonadales bacterium]